MSVHDETWDKCPKCKNTIKDWHGNFHDSGGCLDFVDFHSWEKEVGNNLLSPRKPKASSKLMFPTVIPPTYWSIDKEIVLALKQSVELGIEYTQECLLVHDVDFGRTTRKNEIWAETMESDIDKMKKTLEAIKNYDNPTNNP